MMWKLKVTRTYGIVESDRFEQVYDRYLDGNVFPVLPHTFSVHYPGTTFTAAMTDLPATTTQHLPPTSWDTPTCTYSYWE